MRNPRDYTLGEIEVLIHLCDNLPKDEKDGLDFYVDYLFDFVTWQQQYQQTYRVKKVVEEIKRPQPVSRRLCKIFDDDELASCVLVEY